MNNHLNKFHKNSYLLKIMSISVTEHDIEFFIDKYFRGRNEEIKTIIKSLKKQEILSWAKIIMSSEFRQIFPTEKEIKKKLGEKELKIFEELLIMIPLNYIYWRDCIKHEQLFPTTEQNGPYSWAYAIATIIHLTMRRIIGMTAPSFEEILKDLLKEFANQKDLSLTNILTNFLKLPKYQILHFEEVPEKKINLFDPVRTYHLYICTFSLTDEQWQNFATFYKDPNNKDKILTCEDLIKSQSNKKQSQDKSSGHAVIAIDADSASITYLNSWGKNWGDEGKFSVERGAISTMKYYDVFWFYKDLSQVEKSCYENRTKKAIETFYRIFDYIGSLPEIEDKNNLIKKVLIEFCEDYWRSGQQTSFRFLDETSDLKNEITNLIKKSKEKVEKIQSNEKKNCAREFTILDEETINQIDKIDEIGFGGGGRVYKVAMKSFYALKEMIVNESNKEKFKDFLKEYEIMNLLDHPNIINTYGIFFSSSDKPPCILLEFCPLNLQKAIEKVTTSNTEIAKYVYQIAEGFRYIHFRQVIHRDLKPTNILIASDGTIKISDFGISRLMSIEEQSMTRGVGTQKFMAPEIINEEEFYNEKVDVYSFGVVLYFMLSGGHMPKIKIGEILKGNKAQIPESFNELAKNIILDCWNFEPNERPSFKEIIKRLENGHYEIVNLTSNEQKVVDAFVKKHQELIPSYDD